MKRTPTPHERAARAPSLWFKLTVWLAGSVVAMAVTGILLVAYALLVMMPNLPSLEALTEYRPRVPLRIYTADHVLIGEFGAERRHLVRIQDMPEMLKKAVLAIEDFRFYEHGGIDFIGILRAGAADILHGATAQGASTITMQVARNFFLSREKTYTRKLYEMLLAYRIEATLSKDQILELYMNQIYLGQRAYGFAAAARVYFGKELENITLAEAAMLAGLPKAPSAQNPVADPQRARARQAYILKRMLELHYIDALQYEAALRENLNIKGIGREFSVHAEYAAEIVRQIMVAQYQEEAYTRGLNVVTTIRSADQDAAYRAVRNGVMTYERRHGYRGPEAYIDLPAAASERERAIDEALLRYVNDDALMAAVVISANDKAVRARLLNGDTVTVNGEGLDFAAAALNAHAPYAKRIAPGAIIRVTRDARQRWSITQLPQVEGALVSLCPQDGTIPALVGGFSFHKNNFNHVTQAWRQPGSSFKPFIYSAALEKGLAPATMINDAPLYFSAAQTGGRPWQPKNFGDRYDGPVTLRTGLIKSKNLVSIRILDYIRPKYAQRYLTRFGFDASRHPPYLPMALGTGSVTPLQMAVGYAVFANGGYRINPYLIKEVSDQRGVVIARAQPLIVGKDAPRVIDARNAYIMTNLLQAAAQHGTGVRSNVLGRSDLAGKTGTTNDSLDVWFAGFQPTLAAVTWLGYDQPKSLGKREVGASSALPIWIDYMRRALQDVPPYQWPPRPAGIVEIDGALYYDNFAPGRGFVARIGVNQKLPASAADTPINETEKQDIMNLFRRQ